jgi:hypothetical protein
LHPLDEKKIAFSRFSVSCVSFSAPECYQYQQFGGSFQDFTFHPGRGVPALPWGDAFCCLIAVAQGLAEGNNFPDLQMNSDCKIS